MKFMIFALVPFLVFPRPCFSRDKAGNGGDAVVCRDANKKIISTELLDYYEGRVLRDMTFDLGAQTLSYQDKLELAMTRLERISPLRAALYRADIASFISNTKFLSGNTLVPIPDAEPISYPDGCAIEQLAVQKTPEFPGDKLFTIDQDLWDQLSSDSRAGLILHEIIYKEALTYGHENSVYVRYLNSLLASPSGIGQIQTQKQVYDLMLLIHFSVTDFYGVRFALSGEPGSAEGLAFDTDRLNETHFTPAGHFLSGSTVAFPGVDSVTLQSQKMTVDDLVSFFEDGSIAELHFLGKFVNHPGGGIFLKNVAFYPDGKMKIGNRDPFPHPMSHIELLGDISYNENGVITSASLGPQPISGKNFRIVPFQEVDDVEFYPSGYPKTLQANLNEGSSLSVSGQKISLVGVSAIGECALRFTSGGFLVHTCVNDGYIVPIQAHSVEGLPDSTLDLREDGGVSQYVPYFEVELSVGGQSVEFEGGTFMLDGNEIYTTVTFFNQPGDVVESGYIGTEVTLPLVSGGSRLFRQGDQLFFNRQGLVDHFVPSHQTSPSAQ